MKTQITEPNTDTIGTFKHTKGLSSLVYVLVLLLAAVSYSTAQPGGTWTPLNTSFPGGYPEQALLLTDGSVLVQSGSNYADWYKLTPDSSGHYVKGTWKKVASIPASFNYAPFDPVTAVLMDGRVAVIGAEDNYAYAPPSHDSVGAIYDPGANTWTQVLPPDFGDTCAQDGTPNGGTYWCSIGEGPSGVLNDGSLLVSNSGSGGGKLEALLPPPYTGRRVHWIQTGSGKADINSEQGFTLLPSLDPQLSIGVTADTYHGFGPYGTLPTPICAGVPAGSLGWNSSEIYYNGQIGSTVYAGVWSCLGDTQVQLWGADDSGPPGTRLSYDEMGPAVLRPDGTVFQAGANVNSATAILGTNLTWTAGPYFPTDINCTSNCPPLTIEDGPVALLPDGNVLMMASPGRDTTPVAFFELT